MGRVCQRGLPQLTKAEVQLDVSRRGEQSCKLWKYLSNNVVTVVRGWCCSWLLAKRHMPFWPPRLKEQ